MNALAASLQTYFTTFAHSQRDLSSNTIGSYRDTWRMLMKYLTATLGVSRRRDRLRRRHRDEHHRVPRLPRTRTRQQRQDPQRPPDRDPLRAQPSAARPPRTRSDDHPGPRDPTQTHDQTGHRVPHARRGRRPPRRTRSDDPDRTTRPRSAGHDRADRPSHQRGLLAHDRRHPPRHRPSRHLHRQGTTATHHALDQRDRERDDGLPDTSGPPGPEPRCSAVPADSPCPAMHSSIALPPTSRPQRSPAPAWPASTSRCTPCDTPQR